jgi:hypothetical protein
VSGAKSLLAISIAEFLVQLADQRVLRTFSRLDLAAREFPQAGQRPPLRALGDQHGALSIEQSAGRDDDEAPRAFGHSRIRGLMQFCLNAGVTTDNRH